ncbi:rhodanese-like domain-containing protein [Nitratifractor sp.]
MTKKLISFLMVFGLMSAFVTGLYAGDAPTNKKKLTPQGKYLTPQEAYDKMQKEGDKVLFVDVRTPEELYFVGYPTVVDKNIPLAYVDYSKFKKNKKGEVVKFASKPNKQFLAELEEALKAKGLNKDSEIILMCRSGHRAAKAAKILDKAGYKNVYNLDQGFEGDKDKQKHRTVNGWKNAGLPYTYKVNDKVFILH